MIHFACICGEPFDVPADLAGDEIQCPVCRRLVDVPQLGETDAFSDDGTVRLSDAHNVPSALDQKFQAFGGHADMRPTIDEFLLAGTGNPATESRRRPAPRYDPITGELMVPVEITDDELPTLPPVDLGAPVLGYARTVPQASESADPSTLKWWNLPWRLLGGMSLVAMLVVYVAHAVMYLPMLMPGFNILWLPLTLGVTVMLIAHYCNTMEDFGPNDRDNVPVLLRNASFSEDIWHPLISAAAAGFYAFGPLMLVSVFSPPKFLRYHEWVGYALTAWGMLIFPLAVFTTVCGGVMHNLTPGRMWSVVKAAPAQLVLASLTFWLAMLSYGVASNGITFGQVSQFSAVTPTKVDMVAFLLRLCLTFAGFASAVYLMHLAGAWMGLMYRAHHLDFDWLLQRHDRVYRNDVMVELLKRRGQGLPDVAPRPVLPIPEARRHRAFEVKTKH